MPIDSHMHSSTPKFSLILPCYNEMEHIEVSLGKITRYLDFLFSQNGYEIVLVDDGSRDGTRDFLKAYKAGPSVRVVLHENNRGRGAAVKTGLNVADGDFFGFMDIDCEVSEVYIPKFLEKLVNGADIVVADRSYNISLNPYVLARQIASMGYRRVVELLIKSPVNDSEAGYKFFSKKARDLILQVSKFDNWFWDTEVVQIGRMFDLKIEEVQVLFHRNVQKTSTVVLTKDIPQYLKSISQFKTLRAAGAYKLQLAPGVSSENKQDKKAA